MARGNQREQARAKNLKDQAGAVSWQRWDFVLRDVLTGNFRKGKTMYEDVPPSLS
jgi:hypothetical protein